MHPGTERVDAILMASGFSRRFGVENKLLAPFCRKPLLHYPLFLACESGLFHRVFLVTQDSLVKEFAKNYPVTVLHNEHPDRGQSESVRLGVANSTADYYLFLPCDQPLLDFETLQGIVALRKPQHIVQPCFEKRVGNPVLFSAHFKAELLALGKDVPARSLIKRHSQAVLHLPLASETPLLDADTPEELAFLAEMFQHSYQRKV